MKKKKKVTVLPKPNAATSWVFAGETLALAKPPIRSNAESWYETKTLTSTAKTMKDKTKIVVHLLKLNPNLSFAALKISIIYTLSIDFSIHHVNFKMQANIFMKFKKHHLLLQYCPDISVQFKTSWAC